MGWEDDLRNAFDPNKNGVAKAFDPNQNGVAKAFDPNQNGVANAFENAFDPNKNGIATAANNWGGWGNIGKSMRELDAGLKKAFDPNLNGVAAGFKDTFNDKNFGKDSALVKTLEGITTGIVSTIPIVGGIAGLELNKAFGNEPELTTPKVTYKKPSTSNTNWTTDSLPLPLLIGGGALLVILILR